MKVKMLKMSGNGKIKIPAEIRKRLQLEKDDLLAIAAEDDYIFMKKVDVLDWDEIFSQGDLISKAKNITPADIVEACSEVRQEK
ncbi:MAG: AbrB/MazE/SpoVT family DNA-binding domain-containing protein [Promethearchaeia archaeon]